MSRVPDRFRLIVFDLDGVLADTSPLHERAYRQLWREIGVDAPPYGEALAGRPTREVIAAATGALAPSAAQLDAWTRRKQTLARELIGRGPIAFPDTPAALAVFARTAPLAVATGASRATAETVLQRLGLADRFTRVLTAEDSERGKPAPDVYLRILAEARVPAAAALIVEDSPQGLAAAVASGAWVASVRTGAEVPGRRFLGSYRDLADLAGPQGLELR